MRAMAEKELNERLLPEPITLHGPAGSGLAGPGGAAPQAPGGVAQSGASGSEASLDELLGREWVLANRQGTYASASAAGANTRRYHGLLVAATQPPVGRIVALSCVFDQFLADDTPYDLATFEFDHAVLPNATPMLEQVRIGASVEHIFRCGLSRVAREIVLSETANAVAVRYRLLSGPAGRIRIRPFAALRDFHSVRKIDNPQQMTFRSEGDQIIIEDRHADSHALRLRVHATPAAKSGPPTREKAELQADAQLWYRFRFRGDLARGHEGAEDLYSPGTFELPLTAEMPVQLTAAVGEMTEVNVPATLEQKKARWARLVDAVGATDEFGKRLAVATDLFIADRHWPVGRLGKTILAGFHWFADWGRDTMIALPGLLLETGRHEEALEVLRTFAAALQNGMIPNRFDDYAQAAHYNSIDASLWFVLAAERYVQASGDEKAWARELAGPVERILQSYHDGAMFDIHADADGLLTGGSDQTQLTWMDVKLGGIPVTPRHGKCVEVNALWHSALRIAARRCADGPRARMFGDWAQQVANAFAPTFWNEHMSYLYDCVMGQWKDGTLRPNQVIAVAMPDCPLSIEQQRSVVEAVQTALLTPVGLRSLSPFDSRYRGHFGMSLESRDKAYHQGMVWGWLIGPFIEAYLRVNAFSAASREQARRWLDGFEKHLGEAGLGSVSEVFDGDEPHAPGGCIAQAWSVAEVLRAKRLIESAPPKTAPAKKPRSKAGKTA